MTAESTSSTLLRGKFLRSYLFAGKFADPEQFCGWSPRDHDGESSQEIRLEP